MNIKELSFCTTHMKRFEQISQTLPINLKDNEKYADIIEFIVVDFIIDGDSRLHSFIHDNFMKELESGYLKYFSTTKLKYFHGSICKNTAHRLSTGEILVNLDGDNYTGKNGGKVVLDLFKNQKNNIFIHQESNHMTGNCGRISYYRKCFFAIGGYDESFLPCGHHDRDLMKRLKKTGINKVIFNSEQYSNTITNSKKETIRYTNSNLEYNEMVELNKIKSIENIIQGRLKANTEKEVIGIHPLCDKK